MKRFIHGSEDSIDLDVFYLFDKMPNFQECQEFCSDDIENRNIIVMKDGIVIDCYKGTIDEINNGLYYTYNLHQQDFENPIEKLVERDILIKTLRVVRCFLSHCSRTKYRDIVKKALKSASWKYKISVFKDIDFKNIKDYGKNGTYEDTLKIFAFQLGQVLALYEGIELYTKSQVASKYKKLKQFLYREKNSNINDLIEYIDKFISIIEKYEVIEEKENCYFKNFDRKLKIDKI